MPTMMVYRLARAYLRVILNNKKVDTFIGKGYTHHRIDNDHLYFICLSYIFFKTAGKKPFPYFTGSREHQRPGVGESPGLGSPPAPRSANGVGSIICTLVKICLPSLALFGVE